MRGFQTLENIIYLLKAITASPLSQVLKRGQAGEGTAGDTGDGIGIEPSAM